MADRPAQAVALSSEKAVPGDVRLILDGSGADGMRDALVAAPLSPRLKRLLLSELFGDPCFHAGPEGITYFPGATAPDTGDFRIKAKLGRAGVAFARAFGALRACALDEVRDGCHEPSSIEITPERISAGVTGRSRAPKRRRNANSRRRSPRHPARDQGRVALRHDAPARPRYPG